MAASTAAALQLCAGVGQPLLNASGNRSSFRTVQVPSSCTVGASFAAQTRVSHSGRNLVKAVSGEGAGEGAAVNVSGEKESVDVLPSGEWAHNFSMLNYEDLHAHYEEKEQQGEVTDDPSSPILPDKSHGVVSGEWSKSISILSYEDLSTYFQQQIFKEDAKPSSLVADIMKREVRTAFPESSLGEIKHHFEHVTGLPVVDENLVCIGVVSKGDQAKASDDAKVKDVMTSPPVVTMTPEKSVLFAATMMLKNKVHRIPIVNDAGQLVGIVTRTDIFTVLEAA